MEIESVLSEYDLFHKEGLQLGSFRLADLDTTLIDEIIQQENDRADRLGRLLNPANVNLYNRIRNKFYTYEEFINLPQLINERTNRRYKKDLEGYFDYMQDTKPPLASFFLDYRQPYFSDAVRHCHTYITGRSGLGKSEIMKNIIINHIIRKNCAVVLIEPHGDLARQVYKSQVFSEQEQAERLIVIDYNLDTKYTPVLNIFDQIDCKKNNGSYDENAIDRVSQEYSKALSSICSDGKTSDLSYKMEVILRFCVRVILRKENGCMWDLLCFMSNNNADLVEFGKQDTNLATKDFFTTKDFNKDYRETKEAIYNRLQNLMQDTVFQNLTTGKSTVNIKRAINSKKIIVVNLSKGAIGSYASSSFGKLLIAVIKIIGLQREKIHLEWQRVNTQIFVDEFQNYISDSIEEILEELRKYKIFLTLANQFVGQSLDTDQMKSIFANTGMKIVAQTSPDNSTKIAKELSVEAEKLNNLAQGEYYLMYANAKKIPITLKIKGSEKYLGDKYTMDKAAWDDIKNRPVSI